MTSLEELNRGQRLANSPSELQWTKVEGVSFRPSSNHPGGVLSIAGRDHSGAEVKFWTDLPNAMYLMNMLANIQRDVQAPVPSTQPAPCAPYDGSS